MPRTRRLRLLGGSALLLGGPASGFMIGPPALPQSTKLLHASVSEPQQARGVQWPGSVPFDADGREAVFNFERRLKEAGVDAKGLEHAMFMEPGDVAPTRGILATEDTPTTAPVITLPRTQAIYLEEDEATPFAQWVPEKLWKQLPWYAKLGLKLVYERKMSTSPLKTAYADLLPPPGGMPTPLHWPDGELSELRRVYPALAGKVERQRAAWGGLYDLLGKTRAVREDMDEETFVWAMESVLSRAFKGSFGTGFRSLAVSAALMVLFGGIYEVDQDTIQLVSYVLDEYPWAAAVPAALTLLPLFLEFARSKGTYVLAPMVDSLNHKSSVPTDLDYDSARQRFKLTLGKGFQRGTQVFMSYGQKSNDELLQYYAFVEGDNPGDVFEFGDMTAWLRQRRPALVNEERVQTVYSKGLQDAVKACKLRRGGRVDPKAVEGLRILLASDAELRAENDITESIIQSPMFMTLDEFEDSVFDKELQSDTEVQVYRALAEACEDQVQLLALSEEEERRLARSTASSSGEGSSSPPPTSEVAGRLLLTFRQEKVRLLRECGAKFRAYSQRLASGVREKEGKREA